MANSRLRAPPIRDDGLQIAEERSFQRLYWTSQRWVWLAFGLIVLAALAGLTGRGGYFAQKDIKLSTGEVQAPLFARWRSPGDLTIRFAQPRSTHTILLSRPFLDSFAIERIQPEPRTASLSGGNIHLEFAAAEGGGHTVIFRLQPTSPGIARYRAVLDGVGVDLTTFVLP